MKKITKTVVMSVTIVCFLLIAGYILMQTKSSQHLIKGLIYETEFQFKEAIKEYEKGAHSTAVLSKIAALYSRIGKRDKAVEVLKKVIEIDKDDIEAHFDLAGTYRAMGQFEDAIKEYETALILNSQSVSSLDSLGNIYYDQGKMGKAIEYYRMAININPNFAPAHNDLGNAYHKQGKIKEAVAEYKKAVALDVNFNLARQNLLLAEEELQKERRPQ